MAAPSDENDGDKRQHDRSGQRSDAERGDRIFARKLLECVLGYVQRVV